MNTVKTFIKNSVANYGQKIIRSGIGIVTIGMTARYLSTDAFGQYSYILALITISEITAGMGVPMILCREVAKERARASTLLASGLIIQSVLSTATIVILGLIFYLIEPSKEVFYAALICGVAETFIFLERFFWSIFQAYERMFFGTLQTFINQGLYLIFLIVAINRDLGLYGIFTALLLAHLAGAILSYVLVVKVFAKPEFKDVKGLCKFLLRESFPLAIRGVFRKLQYRAGTLLLAAMRSKTAVGMFSGPYRIVLNLVFTSEASSQAIFPILSRLMLSSKSSLDIAYQTSMKFALLIGFPVAIFLSKFSEPIVVLILGHKYIESAPVLTILAWSLVPLFLTGLMEKLLIAGNKQGLTTVTMVTTLGVNILLNLLLIPKMSYIGSGIAIVISEMVALCFSFYFISRHLRLLVTPSIILKPLSAGLATYGILSMLPDINLFIGGLLEIIIYIAILFAIRTFTKEEICFFKQLWRET